MKKLFVLFTILISCLCVSCYTNVSQNDEFDESLLVYNKIPNGYRCLYVADTLDGMNAGNRSTWYKDGKSIGEKSYFVVRRYISKTITDTSFDGYYFDGIKRCLNNGEYSFIKTSKGYDIVLTTDDWR